MLFPHARPLAHHANCRRAVPLRLLLTHAVSPTFRYGAFLFAAFALAALLSDTNQTLIDSKCRLYSPLIATIRQQRANMVFTTVPRGPQLLSEPTNVGERKSYEKKRALWKVRQGTRGRVPN